MKRRKGMKRGKLKEWEALVSAGEIDPLIWMVHFGGRRPDKCGCKNCADYKAGVCEGGRNPFECMVEKSRTEIVLVSEEDEEELLICPKCGGRLREVERMDTAHDFYMYEREDGKIVWKCLYCGLEIEDFDEMWERQDEPCEP
ncbi:MAG: hypothetical protein OD814_001806 [Candidatus Alkanophagales archaeon MCA70_species_1]|nr:hypothetical protein [Candidatus Alkanophaga volatiphilum]